MIVKYWLTENDDDMMYYISLYHGIIYVLFMHNTNFHISLLHCLVYGVWYCRSKRRHR